MPGHSIEFTDKRTYHVMMRGNNKEKIFIDRYDKEKMKGILEDKKREGGYRLFAYCIMDNHIHLVIKEENEELHRIIKRIGTSYAYYFNKKYKRIGHVFQDRYRSEEIENGSHLLSVIRYVHQNPLKAKINTMEEYPWSSYGDYLGREGSITDTYAVLGIISEDWAKAVREFVKFNHEKSEDIFIESSNLSTRNELVKLLLEKVNLSRRGIASLLGLGRETARKVTKETSL